MPRLSGAADRHTTRPGLPADGWLRGSDPGVGTGRGERALRPAAGERPTALALALVALIAMVMLGPVMTIADGTFTGEGSIQRQLGYLAILGLVIFAIRPVATRTSLVALPWPVLLALGWAWLSVTWAVDPGVSARRVLLTTLVAWMIYSLVSHGGYRLSVTVLRWSLLACVLVSYLFVYLDPKVGVHLMKDSQMPTALIGNWRGILGHKNFAGAVCALCMITFLFDAGRVKPAIRVAALVVCGYFLYRSQSKTSAGMLVLASAGGLVFETVSLRLRAYIVPLLSVGGAIGWTAISAYSDTIRATALNPNAFTGRGQIWATLLSFAQDHPVFGAGFGSFWNVGPDSPVYRYGHGYVTQITVGHSGYLDQLVAVGAPGVLLMVFAVAVWPMWRLLASRRLPKGRGALITATLMFCVGHNTTESGLFERDMIVSSVLFLAAALAQYATAGERTGRTSRASRRGDDLLRAVRSRQPAAATLSAAGE